MLKIDVDSFTQFAVVSADGAIGDLLEANTQQPLINGTVLISKGSAAALTLRAPIAGNPDGGGEDGRTLRIKAISAYAHVITTPANKVNGNADTITLGGAVGDGIDLFAYNGVWYSQRNDHAVLTEV